MCGICGFALHDPNADRLNERLVESRHMIGHRGPDGVGQHVSDGVGLGHVRLSIIDVATGAQPLSNEDESIWITYNGEVYNYADLTAALLASGHRFRTRSDTEALVHAYEEYGPGFVTQLNGMFAFAIHDQRRRRVVLARDHFGIKPLYYAVTPEGLFFGSEIKSVLAGMGARPSLRFESLQEYLMFRYVAGEHTFFEGIQRLPPGHLAIWEEGRLEVRPYWTIARAEGQAPSVEEAVEQLDGKLSQSVKSQLMSEVPLGTFCSGGLDSGLVTVWAARHSPHRLKAFSVGFDDRRWDETELARQTAARAGAEPHHIVARPATFAQALARLVWHHDEPLSHPNSVPIFFLSRFAREHVTVALTGEGADELFGGYPRYQIARLSGMLDHVAEPLRNCLARLAGRLPGGRARRLAEVLPFESHDAMVFNSMFLQPREVIELTGALTDQALSTRRAIAAQTWTPGDPIASITRYDVRTYLGCLLDRMDRMTMASSLEGRVPFLDLGLAEWALGLPSNLKVRGRSSKVTVRRAAKRHLSPAVMRAPKSGFGIPLNDWFQEPAFRALTERLQDPGHPAAPFFQARALDRILKESASGGDHGEALWLITNVFLWTEIWSGDSWRTPPRFESDDTAPSGISPRAA